MRIGLFLSLKCNVIVTELQCWFCNMDKMKEWVRLDLLKGLAVQNRSSTAFADEFGRDSLFAPHLENRCEKRLCQDARLRVSPLRDLCQTIFFRSV